MLRPHFSRAMLTTKVIVRVIPRLLPRAAILLALVIGLMVAALVSTATLAAGSASEIAHALAQGTGQATAQLLLASAWWLLPLAVMLAALLAFTGTLFHLADAELSGARVSGVGALAMALSRLHRAAVVALVYAVTVLLSAVAAPLICLLALVAVVVIDRAARRHRSLPAWFPSRRRATLLAIPLFLAFSLAVRWSIALGEVFLAGSSAREALASSWNRARGRMLQTGIVLVIGLGAAFAISWGVMALSLLSESVAVEFAVQLACSLLLAPIPAVTLLVLYRDAGGPSSTLVASVTRARPVRRRSSSIPVAVSFALVATVLSPPPSAWAVEESGETPAAVETEVEVEPELEVAPEPGSLLAGQPDRDLSVISSAGVSSASLTPTTVTFEHALPDPWEWMFGGSRPAFTGEVVADSSGTTPTGQVRLWGSMNHDPVHRPLGEPETLVNGTFDLDGGNVVPGITGLHVEYLGDDAHEGSSSAPQATRVHPKALHSEPELLHPVGVPTVGDRAIVRVQVDAYDEAVTGHAPSGDVEIIDAEGSGHALDRAEIIDGHVTFEFVVMKTSMHLAMKAVDDSRYFFLLGGGEWVIQAHPAPTSIDLHAQQEVALGSEATVIAQVRTPAGVPASGTAEFTATVAGRPGTTSLGASAVVDGRATLTFCVGTSADPSSEEGCGTTPHLLVESSDASIEVTARYEPHSGGLLPSTSAPRSLSVTPAGPLTGACKVVDLRTAAYGLPHATAAQRDGLGSPHMETRTNCTMPFDPVAGHRTGTMLVVHARPAPGYQLAHWEHDGVAIGTQSTLVWQLPALPDRETEVIEAVYEPLCLPFDVRTRGSAAVTRAVPVDNANPLAHEPGCDLPDGTRGAYLGSVLSFSTEGVVHADTGERDVFARATVNGVAVSPQFVSRNGEGAQSHVTHTFAVPVERETRAVVDYVHHCRAVQLGPDEDATDSTLGTPELLTAPNCFTSLGTGYLRGTEVTVSATLDGPYDSLVGWHVNGELDSRVEAAAQTTVVIGAEDVTTIAFELARCYPVEVTVRQGHRQGPATRVAVSPAPNCADGSERYEPGTLVTLTPSSSLPVLAFGGWKDLLFDDGGSVTGDRIAIANYPNNAAWHRPDAELVAGTMTTAGDREVVLEGPLVTTAHFYNPHACSNVQIIGGGVGDSDIRLSDETCGPGRYYDQAKAELPVDGIYRHRDMQSNCHPYPPEDRRAYEMANAPMQEKHYVCDWRYRHTTLEFRVPGALLDLQGTVTMRQESPSSVPWRWSDTTELACGGATCWAEVRGDVTIRMMSCQPLEVDVRLRVVGDESDRVYAPAHLGLQDFDWVVSETPGCAKPLTWHPGTTAVLQAQSPVVGIEFIDWTRVDNLAALELFTDQDPTDPRAPLAVHATTDDAEPALRAGVEFAVHCATLDIGHVTGVLSPAPNCPGAEGMSYIVGTFIEAAASARNIEGRRFVRFENGTIIAGTEGVSYAQPYEVHGFNPERAWVREMMREQARFSEYNKSLKGPFTVTFPDHTFNTGITLVRHDGQKLRGYYQYPDGPLESFGKTLANFGKLTVGFVSLGITAAIPLCPPCAAALTVLTLSEYLVRLIPGADAIANVIAMANPMKFIECTTKWGFNSLDPAHESEVSDEEFAASLVGGATRAYQSIVVSDAAQLERFEKWSLTKSGAAMATFALGAYENRVWDNTFRQSSASEFRDTAAYEQCLSNTWKDPTT